MERLSRRSFVVLVAVLAATVIGSTAAVAATKLRTSDDGVTRVTTVTGSEWILLPGWTWKDMPGMKVAVNVPAEEPALLLITLSGQVKCIQERSLTHVCAIRVLVDGVGVQPGAIDFSFPTYFPQGLSMQWVSGPVGFGAHEVTVQYIAASHEGWPRRETYAEIGPRTLTVMNMT